MINIKTSGNISKTSRPKFQVCKLPNRYSDSGIAFITISVFASEDPLTSKNLS